MKQQITRRRALFASAALATFAFLPAFAVMPVKPIKVVATIPDLADFAKQIGGGRVEIKTLSKGTENLHNVHVRPSMLIALSRADLFLEMGLSMEAAWLPELLVRSGNKAIQPGAKGFQNCSEGWNAIEVPETLSRKRGHLHPEGNPHFNFDPLAGRHLAVMVHAALMRVDPGGEELFDANLKTTLKALEAAEARWAKLGAKWKDRKVCVYHTEYNYFAHRYGMQVAISIEPQPGMPPTPSDVARVIKEMRELEVDVILTAAWSNNRQVADIARKTGAKVVELPNQVKGADWAKTWISFQDGLHARVATAFGTDLEERQDAKEGKGE